VVLGDAEGIWGRVVADARAGRLEPRYEQAEFATLEAVEPIAASTMASGTRRSR